MRKADYIRVWCNTHQTFHTLVNDWDAVFEMERYDCCLDLTKIEPVTAIDFGYPWGLVEVPEGWTVEEVPASCGGECEEVGGITSGHFACTPGWEEEVRRRGGIVVAGPVLVGEWKALVAFPPK